MRHMPPYGVMVLARRHQAIIWTNIDILGSAAAEVPVKFHNDWKSLNQNIAASRLQEILR